MVPWGAVRMLEAVVEVLKDGEGAGMIEVVDLLGEDGLPID